jgi:hypothetical protein
LKFRQRKEDTMKTDRSKWAILNEQHQKLDRLETQECGLTCSGCGKVLETEKDFAEHYLVPDERFLNLGYCPDKDKGLRTIEGNTES